MIKKDDFKNIVIVRTDRIGEVLLSAVSADAVKKKYPDAKISFVTSKYSKPLLENRRDLNEVFGIRPITKRNWLREAVSLAFLLRKRKFDAAIVLNPHKALHLAVFLAGVPLRVGFDRKWSFLLNRKVPDERNSGRKHEIEYTMELLRLVGVEGGVPSPRLIVEEKAAQEINRLFVERGIALDKPVISVHPGSSNPAKIWPGENYSQLISRITNELNCSVILLGGKEERGMADSITAGSAKKDVYNLAGLFNLKELAALLKKSSLFIGNDAGPMHMAAALGVSVIAIFVKNVQGTGPVRWRPWGDKHTIFYETQDAMTCHCTYDLRCMEKITVDAVFKVVREKLIGGT